MFKITYYSLMAGLNLTAIIANIFSLYNGTDKYFFVMLLLFITSSAFIFHTILAFKEAK